MTSPLEFWNGKHHQYAVQAFVRKPNLFAQEIAGLLKPGAHLLDLGCGQGQDAVYFAKYGLSVTACDFSEFAVSQFRKSAEAVGITQVLIDLAAPPYPFPDSAFDVVYAHLSLHYFDENTTRRIFAEIARVLRHGGHFYSYFNSVHDPESNEGTLIEPQFRELSPGDRKRYFTTEELPGLLGARFTEATASYGRGTTKNPDDRYVRLAAVRTEGN